VIVTIITERMTTQITSFISGWIKVLKHRPTGLGYNDISGPAKGAFFKGHRFRIKNGFATSITF
jgi:hypothetical protein